MTAPVTVRVIPSQGPFCEDNFTVSFFIPFAVQVSCCCCCCSHDEWGWKSGCGGATTSGGGGVSYMGLCHDDSVTVPLFTPAGALGQCRATDIDLISALMETCQVFSEPVS
jgi:hypothetical protein